MGILFLSPRVGRPDHLPVLGEIDSEKGVTAGKAIKNIPRTLDVEASWTELLASCPSVPRSLPGSQMLDELSLMARGKDRLTTSIQERKKILSVMHFDKVKTAHLLIRVARAIENLTTIAVHVLSGLDHPNAHMVPMESLTHIKLNRVCHAHYHRLLHIELPISTGCDRRESMLGGSSPRQASHKKPRPRDHELRSVILHSSSSRLERLRICRSLSSPKTSLPFSHTSHLHRSGGPGPGSITLFE